MFLGIFWNVSIYSETKNPKVKFDTSTATEALLVQASEIKDCKGADIRVVDEVTQIILGCVTIQDYETQVLIL